MSEELKPCPFCGNDAPREGKISGAVWCEDCHSVGNDQDRWNTRPAEDALAAKVKELEARLKDCETALIGMVEQYCRVSDSFTERECSHDFMHGPEEAFDYLTRNGFAEWTQNENIILKDGE